MEEVTLHLIIHLQIYIKIYSVLTLSSSLSADYVSYAFGLVSEYLSLQWSERLKESLR